MSNRINNFLDQNRDRDRDTYKGTVEEAKNDLAKMKTYLAAIKNGEIDDMYKTSTEALIDSIYKKYSFLKPMEIPEELAGLESISAKSILAQHSEDLEYDIDEVISNNFPEQNSNYPAGPRYFNHPAEQISNHPAGPRYFNHPAEQNSNYPAGPKYSNHPAAQFSNYPAGPRYSNPPAEQNSNYPAGPKHPNHPAEPGRAIYPAGQQIVYALPQQTNQKEMKIGIPPSMKFLETKEDIIGMTFEVLYHILNYGAPERVSTIYTNIASFNRGITNKAPKKDLFKYFEAFLNVIINKAETNTDVQFLDTVIGNKVRNSVGQMLGMFLDYALNDEIFETLNISYNKFRRARNAIDQRTTSIDYMKWLSHMINGRF